MEEITIWEQHTATISKDPRRGFGIAISGSRERQGGALVVSDVVPGGPAEGRLHSGDLLVMVNGVPMESASSSFAIQTLRTCGKQANITVKRPRRVQLPAARAGPRDPADEGDPGRGYDGDTSSGSGHSCGGQRSRRRRKCRGQDDASSQVDGLALVSGFKRLPRQDMGMRPLTSVLVRRAASEEFGVTLGSQIFIKHITDSGLAARNRGLQEGDLILQINGVPSANLSLGDTRRLIEQSEGTLTLLVLRDDSQFLVNIPPAVSDSDGDSSLLEDISELGSELSQAPPSHVPPPPQDGRQSPEDSIWSGSPDTPEERPGRQWESPVDSRTVSEPDSPLPPSHNVYQVPGRQIQEDRGYSPDSRVVRFCKGANVGLRLAGGNDLGIFVSGVQPGGPAEGHGIQEGDQILQVNGVSFRDLTREEAVGFLLDLPPGEDVELVTQRKHGLFRKMQETRVADSFFVRAHFELEPSPPSGLGLSRGDVFHVLDTLFPGPGPGGTREGHWLAVRMGRDLREQERGIIPNQSRAEQLASLEEAQRAIGAAPGSSSSSTRAEFWRLRGLRGATKKTSHHRSREDLSALTRQGRYPAYERVVLREASFKRPVVILGPVADIAMQRLTAEMPEQFEIAETVSRMDSPSKIIKLDTVRVIAEKDKHALLDVTPSAIERLNYVQYYPIVVLCAPESRPALKALRQWLAPGSRRSTRRLYAQARKLQKHSGHLFTATIPLQGTSDGWYQELKAVIRQQQGRPIWTAEDQLEGAPEDDLELPLHGRQGSPADLSCDSRGNSDYDTETDGEAFTDGDEGEDGCPPARTPSPQPPGVAQVEGRHAQGQRPQDSMRTYEREALRKKFTRARDVESSSEEGYDWGPATDL
ncbi:tight junction protein ZO-3 isoform X2 [Erinaceus europaeus]|nr:tight junction protein ZO-3 isoform X2 [Erinaceus europaeus]